ncbi:MAG: hypothetical protein AAF740_05045 [Bacteroidota bacterium]
MRTTEYIEYVVVFHGIGEQRANETVLPVINRMAEVRQDQEQPSKKHIISLGMVTSQTGEHEFKRGSTTYFGKPWAEFEGIPREKPRPKTPLSPFVGIPSKTGENIRFVDGKWADIMQSHYESVAQPLGQWASSLIGRLETLEAHKSLPVGEGWVLPVLYRLKESLTLLETLINLRLRGLGVQVFEKYMGDIQLYGEFSVIRGQATKRFHQLFEHIEKEHRKNYQLDKQYIQAETGNEIRPRYTIVAHSLGTIMSLDALMYAHFKMDKVMERGADLPNLPFTGYNTDDMLIRNDRFGETWVDNVDAFITLGSPIDKFLTIWMNNYRYLDDSFLNDGVGYLPERLHKIRHYNYCDEQDPVGHALDILNEKTAYNRVFTLEEDSVYNRYTVPGAAHNEYWNDLELFQHIMENTVDVSSQKREKAAEVQEKGQIPKTLQPTKGLKTFKNSAYTWVLIYSYFLLPLVSLGTMFPAFLIAYYNRDTPLVMLGAAFGLVAGQFITFRLIKLMVWWRQILKAKSKHNTDAIRGQQRAKLLFWGAFSVLIPVHLFGAILYIPGYIEENKDKIDKNFWLALGTMGLLGIMVYLFFRTRAKVKISDFSSTWTAVYQLFIIVAIFALFIFDPYILGFAPEDYSIVIASYLFFAALVWFYTFMCFLAARGALRYR